MDSLSASSVVLGAVTVLGGILATRAFVRHSNQSLPPGPPRSLLLGNALQIPQTHTWLTFSKWAKTYGDIIYLEVIGQPIVVLNSAKMAKDLLDKRSSIYSDRPHMTMGGDLAGYNETFILQPYGDNWRKQRKLVAQDFSQSAVSRYYALQETQARKIIRSTLDDSSSLARQVKLRIGAIIIRTVYGYYIESEDDPFLVNSLKAMENWSLAAAPGAWFVDFIPQLKYLPTWMPGSGFLQTAAEWRQTLMDSCWLPYQWSKKNLASGTALTPNLCGTVISEAGGELSGEDESLLCWSAGTLLGGGLNTNMSTVLAFFLAMVLHPEIQAKARAELDSVMGLDRLPTISDKSSLPYVRSLITEVYRWMPTVPLGIVHRLSEADIYNGMHLPKGTLVLPNVWHMLHDPEAFPDPMSFNPDRYHNDDAEMRKVIDLAFGFGRRACPGIYFAEGTIFAVIATALATCEILPAVDANGKDIVPEVACTSGTIVFPEPFECRLKCRSEQALGQLTKGSAASE